MKHKVNLNHITFNNKHVSHYIVEKEVEEQTKKIRQEHKQATTTPVTKAAKPNLKYKARAERPGKVRHLTQKEIEMEYKSPQDYKTVQQKVIAALLGFDQPATLKQIHRAIPEVHFKSITPFLSTLAATLGKNFERLINQNNKATYQIVGADHKETVEGIDEAAKVTIRNKNTAKKDRPEGDIPIDQIKQAVHAAKEQSPNWLYNLEDALHRIPNGVTIKFTVEITTNE